MLVLAERHRHDTPSHRVHPDRYRDPDATVKAVVLAELVSAQAA
ncbi:hypothetical protein ACFYNO_11725 [Kitasatospora sp. NPDC006697]